MIEQKGYMFPRRVSLLAIHNELKTDLQRTLASTLMSVPETNSDEQEFNVNEDKRI